MIAQVCQIHGSVTPVPEWEILWLSSLLPREPAAWTHRRKKSAITNCSTTWRKPKREISHLEPGFILKSLPQQGPFLSKLQFPLCHIFQCSSNGKGLFGEFSIIIFICTDLASQSEISPSGRSDSRIYTCFSYYRAQAKKKTPTYLLRLKILNFINYV